MVLALLKDPETMQGCELAPSKPGRVEVVGW